MDPLDTYGEFGFEAFWGGFVIGAGVVGYSCETLFSPFFSP